MFDARATAFVVDDDVSVRESIKLLVESAGWRVEAFGCGREVMALVISSRNRFESLRVV
jgi:FixJ family two-component response regulator